MPEDRAVARSQRPTGQGAQYVLPQVNIGRRKLYDDPPGHHRLGSSCVFLGRLKHQASR